MRNVKVYLYDATGGDDEIEVDDIKIEELAEENRLLWIDVLKRDEEPLRKIAAKLNVENLPYATIVDINRRPDIDRFENFFRFCVDSIVTKENAGPKRLMIDYVVGKNFVMTIHDDEVESFKEFRDREKAETLIGRLDAESFVATLLDLNIVSYFRALEELERRVDATDERILKKELEPEDFLKEMVGLRRSVSKLRRWLLPHRDVFYALSRADFQQIAESTAVEQFKLLNQHFETAVDAVENSREIVLGVFELYATKSSQLTNLFVQRLTFLTLLTGSLAVIAGVLGMNFKAGIFEAENGFWLTVAGLAVVGVALTVFARFRRWI